MVLVTMSGRSGRMSSFLLVRHIGCVGHHQPDPVGVGFARRMPNKMRKIHIRHRRQDRLRGVTPPSHGGNQKAYLNHLCIHTTTARGACCREAVLGELRLVDLQANQKSISHQPKHNSRDTTSKHQRGVSVRRGREETLSSPNPATPRRGDIWLVNFDPTVGTEIQKTRPAVVVSSDAVGRLPIKTVHLRTGRI